MGSPEELPLVDLATRRNVLKKMQLEKLRDPRNYRHIPNMDLAEKTGKAVYSAWRKVNHRLEGALVSEREVVRRVFMLWTRMEAVASGGRKKSSGKRKKYGKAGAERESFIADLDKLFDICSCHCPILPCSEFRCQAECKSKVHIKCKCLLENKIPEMELDFIHDQRCKVGVK